MTEEALKARREYQRQYRQKHKEQIKASQERYWQHKAEKDAAAAADRDNRK